MLKVVPEEKVLGRMSVKMGRVEWEGRWFVFHWKFRYLCIDEAQWVPGHVVLAGRQPVIRTGEILLYVIVTQV